MNGQRISEGEDSVTRQADPAEAEQDVEHESVLSEILSYSMRFIPDDNLREMVNGMTSSWKGATPSVSPVMILEAVKDILADSVEVDQGYCDDLEEEIENIPSEIEALLNDDWVVVTHQDCSASEDSDLLSDWQIIDQNDCADI